MNSNILVAFKTRLYHVYEYSYE